MLLHALMADTVAWLATHGARNDSLAGAVSRRSLRAEDEAARRRPGYDTTPGHRSLGLTEHMQQSALRFTAAIRIRGVNPYVEVSARRAGQLQQNWRKPLPVLVRINGEPAEVPWRINMMPTGNGSFYLYLHNSVREASGTRVGDRVTVELDFDRDYRKGPLHPMPRWFRAALADNPRAKLNWNRLIPSRRKEVLRYFAALKSHEARRRNLARAMAALSETPGRFMGRSWSDGK